MLRHITKDEIIQKLRAALAIYAHAPYWYKNEFYMKYDVNQDSCSGNYMKNGEIARQALQYNENTMVPVR